MLSLALVFTNYCKAGNHVNMVPTLRLKTSFWNFSLAACSEGKKVLN